VSEDETAILKLLTEWTRATSDGRQDDVLRNHSDDALIFDVLPPMQYEGTAAYRASWDEWQPDAQGAMRFELEDLEVAAGGELAFAHGLLQCGGTLPDGKTFRDTVRATFCLRKNREKWVVVHQHISKPYGRV